MATEFDTETGMGTATQVAGVQGHVGRQVVRLVVVVVIISMTSIAVARNPTPSVASCAARPTRVDGSPPPHAECNDTNDSAQSAGPAGFFVAMFALLTVAGALIAVSERRTRGD